MENNIEWKWETEKKTMHKKKKKKAHKADGYCVGPKKKKCSVKDWEMKEKKGKEKE